MSIRTDFYRKSSIPPRYTTATMKILLANDDGINAPGLRALCRGLKTIGDVTVAAPEMEMSAVGHAITIAMPLRVREVKDHGQPFGYAVNGTPADCVKIALLAIMKEPPDIVISGINHGANLATNIIYSGTVSAATEGTILGVPSIAFSLTTHGKEPDFGSAVKHAVAITKKVFEKGLQRGTLLNVNIPALPEKEIKGVRICRQSHCVFRGAFEKREDLRGVDYYWQGGVMDTKDPDPNVDIVLNEKGYITITPIHFDLTNHSYLDELRSWEF